MVIDDEATLFGEILRNVNERIGSDERLENTLEFLFDAFEQLIPFDRIGIALIEENQKTVRLFWVKSKIPVRHLAQHYTSSLERGSLNIVMETGQPRILNDLERYYEANPHSTSTRLILEDGMRSSLTCPLYGDGRPMGFVFFSSQKKNTYEAAHVETFLGVASQFSVIIERARLRDFMRQAEKMESAFSRALHDLRAPLCVIKGYLGLAAEDDLANQSPRAKNIFAAIERNANNMLTLLDELNESRHSSRLTLEMRDVSFLEFCSDVAEASRILCAKKDITFQMELGKIPTSAYFDSFKIRRVLENLVTNAVKFSARGTSVVMRVKREKEQLLFEIQDHGQGIAADDISKLFREFGQTKTKPTEGEPTTGLGLAIAKGIVAQHGGEISAESEIGKGSTFKFWIPALVFRKQDLANRSANSSSFG